MFPNGIKCPKELEERSEENQQGGKTTVLMMGMSSLYDQLSLLVPGFQLAIQAHTSFKSKVMAQFQKQH